MADRVVEKYFTYRNSEATRILALYIKAMLRPNWRVRLEIRRRVAAWLAEHPSWPSRSRRLGGSVKGIADCKGTVAMHVRHGDKLTPYWSSISGEKRIAKSHGSQGEVQRYSNVI